MSSIKYIFWPFCSPIAKNLLAVLNKGLNYIKYICKFLGIKKRKEILVDNTGTTQEEKQQAIENGISQIDKVLKSLKFWGIIRK